MKNETNNDVKFIPMYKSYIDAVAKLTPADRLVLYEAIFEYGFTGEEPTFDNPYLEMGWNLVKPNLVNNMKKLKANQKNATKGGRPKKETEPQPEVKQSQPEPIIKGEIVLPEVEVKDEEVVISESPTKEELEHIVDENCKGLLLAQITQLKNFIATEMITTTNKLYSEIEEFRKENK